MPTAPRQPEIQPAPGPERHVTPARTPGPRLTGFTPEAILALQRTAGNQAVARAVSARGARLPAPAPQSSSGLSSSQAVAALQFTVAERANRGLEGGPMRTLQVLLSQPPFGTFDGATFDALNALTPPPATAGVVDEAVLESLLGSAKSKGMHIQFARLVQVLDNRGWELSMSFNPKLGTAYESVAEGDLAKVTLGPSAFASVAALKTAISKATPMINGGVVSTAPQRLGQDELAKATEFNAHNVGGFRSEDIIDRVIAGGETTAGNESEENFAQWVADFQARMRLTVNGRLDDATFAKIVERLETLGRHSSILRLVLDRFKLEHDWIAGVAYDPHLTRQFSIERGAKGPVTIRFGPHAFVSGVAGLIHTIADASRQAHVYGEDQLGGSPHSVREQEMLGKSEQLTSKLPQESRASFKADVNDFLAIWRALTVEERRRNVQTLKNVLQAVEARYQQLGAPLAKHVKDLLAEVARVAEEKKWHLSRE
jgi:hypothetical protein